MWAKLINWAKCGDRRWTVTEIIPQCQLFLDSCHLQELSEWLDWATLNHLELTCRGIHLHLRSDTFLSLLATQRGLKEASLLQHSLESLALVEALRSLRPEIYFERASTTVHEDSGADVALLADICSRHCRHLTLYVSGHCGRNAPEFIKSSFTLERATTVCHQIVECLEPDSYKKAPHMYVYDCGSIVAARDIPLGGASNWSKADLRVVLQYGDEVLVDWGVKWWQEQPELGAEALPEPEWHRFQWPLIQLPS